MKMKLEDLTLKSFVTIKKKDTVKGGIDRSYPGEPCTWMCTGPGGC